MSRWDALGLFWQDLPADRSRGARQLGPMPEIPDTGWKPPASMPNIRDAKWIGFDVETKDPDLQEYGPGWARGVGHICGISVAVDGAKWYFPMRHEVQPELNMDPEMVLRWASWALGNSQPKVGAHLMYDYGWLKHEGVEVGGALYDVQIAEPLLSETSKASLDELGKKYLNQGKTSEVLQEWAQSYYGSSSRLWRKDIYRCPVTMVGPYAEDDAALPKEILSLQWPHLVRNNLIPLFEMECRLTRLLVAMRFEGITVDLDYAEQLHTRFTKRSAELMHEANRIAGFDVNTNAAASMARAFDKLSIPYGRTAPTANHPEGQPSFTSAFLKTVDHPFAKLILEKKGLDKLDGTFVQSYLMDSSINGKIHCSFHQVSSMDGGARTGRLSSSDPNLQNIPVRSEEGKLIRKAFIMDKGHERIRDFDYSQIEYRFLAHFATGAGSDEVRAMYNQNADLDYHEMIGDMIDDKTGLRLVRGHVKNINFGLVYGLGIDVLAGYLGVPLSEAKELSKSFHTAIPFARSTMDDITTDVQRTGVVRTILGRMSHFDDWEPSDWASRRSSNPMPYNAALSHYGTQIMRAYTYRAINYKLQGSAADMMKAAMDKCYTSGVFDETGIPRITVHDELVFSDPGGVREDAWKEMQHICETAIPGIRVPIKFDGGSGPTWGDAK